ncbi:unnamed protein product [Hymenolepis diminuta]|uniref:CST complex subunit CTC1 n=1 Tax=Hymenolepis diminuta TaxID=6216 RepID=A0A0R3SST1_HYMDI|nr:unnamed protein product [Hymenolepis diminuta]
MDEEVGGFIQFRSPEFIVGASNTVMVKVTTTLHCFCKNPIYNIIIAWKSRDEDFRLHRENFLLQIDGLMHQYVRFHRLSRAILFGNKPNEAEVWCYIANESYLELIPKIASVSEHVCDKWPDNLLPSVRIKIVRSFCEFRIIEISDCKRTNKRAILPSFLPNLSPATELTLYGVWMLNNCILHPGILSSWKDEDGVFHTFPSGVSLDSTSVSNIFLRLSLLNSLLSFPDVTLDDYSLEKADSVTKSILADIYPESISPPLPSIRLADEFIRICEFAPTLNHKCKILTTSDLTEYRTFFQPTNECINLNGVKIQFFEPITVASHQEFILIGCPEMKPKTGELVFKPPFPSPTQPSEIPLVFTNLTKSTLSKNLLGEIILIRQPHLIISESVNGQNRDCIRVFGHCLSDIPEICILCDSTPKPLITQVSSCFSEKERENNTSGPIIMRYVSSLSSDGSKFSIRCEHNSVSSSLQDVELCSPLDLWAFSCGLFTIGRRIHLRCWNSSVGLYNWKILGVSEVLDLVRNDAFQGDIKQNKGVMISIQGYVLKQKIANINRRKVSLWLVDSYRHDRTASSSLRIDFIVSESNNRAADELLRLPRLTHVCIFKACLKGSRFILPLSPNRLQVSPNSLSSYLAASDIQELCRCFSDKYVNPVCSVCVPRNTSEKFEVTPEPTLPRMDFLCDEKTPKTCLVHIIRCLNFKVINLEDEDSVRVILKVIISDGSATALGHFDSGELKLSSSSPNLRRLATLLGLEELLTRQVVSNVSRVNEDAKDPVSVGLSAWLASPGFLRQICLTFENDPTPSVNSYWRLNKVNIGREVRLVIPPMQKLRVIN